MLGINAGLRCLQIGTVLMIALVNGKGNIIQSMDRLPSF